MDKSLDILERYYGYKSFRKGQEEIINSILKGKDILAIMPTGGGKSLCYQVPALILDGITLVISPLISLMKDQVDTIKSIGIEGTYINSSLSTSEFNEILEGIRRNKFKIIYVAPERLESYEFINIITQVNISQIAIDEAHCVSQWGHDFRSSYKRISYFINSLINRPIVTAFTATATEHVKDDIINLLGLKNPEIFVTGFDRENLFINVIKSASKKKYLLNYIENNEKNSGIIYCATRKEVDSVYEALKHKGYLVGRYHAGLADKIRKENQEDFIHDRINIIIATNAFGMGIDKPNIRFVIHYNIPQSIEGYYQEIGRAGRDGLDSECILLFTPSDVHTQKYIIEMGEDNIERKNNKYKKLQQMVDLVYSAGCYKSYILNYFGEFSNKDCNNCSNCKSEGEIVDRTIDAQKVISCIYRMKRPFGITMIIDVLRGSKNKKVLQFGFEKLSTYGIMKNCSVDELKTFVNTLVSHGYVDYIEGTYPTVKLNNKSINVIKGEEIVKFKEIKVEKTDKYTDELFEILRELRLEISKEENVPPYVIFGDGALKEMCIKYPNNKWDFLNISGVGQIKYEKYGEKFIKVIDAYIKEHNIKLENELLEEKEVNDLPLEVMSDSELLKRLLEVREALAKRYHVLPQMILSKNTLKEISGRYPIVIENLKDIGGIGVKKIQDYGEDIIVEVQKYVLENNIESLWKDKKRRKLIIDGETRKINEIAIDLIKDGIVLSDISKELEVSVSTILGYVTDYIKDTGDVTFNLNLKEYYSDAEKNLIIDICSKHGYDKISAIKKMLPEYIKYEAIRAVILKEFFKVS